MQPLSLSSRLSKRHVPLNAVASWTTYATQIVTAFVVTPIVVRGLGDQRYGVWSLVESVLAYLILFDFGLTVSVVRYVARFEATADTDRRNRVFSTSLALFATIGVVIFAIAAALGAAGPYLFRIPPDLVFEARWMFVLLGVNIGLGLPLGIYLNVLCGLGRYPTSSAIRVTYLILGSILTVTVITRGGGLIALGCLITAMNTAQNLTMAWAVHRHLPDLRFAPALIDWATFREIRGYSLNAFLAGLGTQISFQTDAIVIGIFLSPTAITYFAIGNKLVGYSKSLFYAVTGVLIPTFSAMDARGDMNGIRSLLIRGSRYVLWAVLPLQVGLIVLGKPFLALWIGPRYATASYPTLVILAVPLALVLTQGMGVRALYGTGRLDWFARAMLVEAAANLLLSIALAHPLGIEGVAWGTTIPNFAFNVALMVYVCRSFGIGFLHYVRDVYVRPSLLACLLAFGWAVSTCMVIPPQTWPILIVTGLCGCLAYMAVAVVVEFGPEPVIQVIRDRLRTLAAGSRLLAYRTTPVDAAGPSHDLDPSSSRWP
jgi:O-antigen/teichoic acid export membrane protein